MTAVVAKRTIWDALIVEPIELAISQPHQAFISALSVYLVASEAAMLAPAPFNWLMAVGAEWAYLRGLSSGDFVKSAWTRRLITAAVALLILYGSLWGFRRFGILPRDESYYAMALAQDAWSIAGAVVLTLVHILSIGAVTFCSAMIHRDTLEAQRVLREKAAQEVAARERAQREEIEARNRRMQESEDRLLIQTREREAELALYEKARVMKARVAAELAQIDGRNQRGATRTQPKIIYNGVEYPSVQAAADAHGITRQAMSKRLKKEAG